jgi:hypothetical protein
MGRRPLVSAGMEIEFTPEPTPEERAALLAALMQREERASGGYGSVWRLAGLLENVDSDDFAPRAAPPVGSPRSSRGANRA